METITVENKEYPMGEFDDIFGITRIIERVNLDAQIKTVIEFDHEKENFTLFKADNKSGHVFFAHHDIPSLKLAKTIGGLI